MTDDYAELRAALLMAPTPGPWTKAFGDAVFPPDSSMPVAWTRDMSPDARYIAAANPSVIAALLADRDRLYRAADYADTMLSVIERDGQLAPAQWYDLRTQIAAALGGSGEEAGR